AEGFCHYRPARAHHSATARCGECHGVCCLLFPALPGGAFGSVPGDRPDRHLHFCDDAALRTLVCIPCCPGDRCPVLLSEEEKGPQPHRLFYHSAYGHRPLLFRELYLRKYL